MYKSAWLCLAVVAVLLVQPCIASTCIKWVEKPFYLYGANPNNDQDWNDPGEGPTRNTDEGICAAVAIANSFAYLYQRYPGVYQDTDLIDVGTNGLDVGDLNGLRDSLAEMIYTNHPGQGNLESMWESKYSWLQTKAPGTTIMDGQVDLPGVDLGKWDNGGVLENKYPEFAFLWNEIYECEDVELVIFPDGSGPGHAISLTGVSWEDDCDGIFEDGEKPLKIRYLDPNGPLDPDGDGVVKPREIDLSWNETESRWEFEWWQDSNNYYITAAFAESPVPEPAAVIVWGLLGLLAVGYARRRKRLL